MMTRLALAALPLTFSVLAKAQISFEPAFFGQDETVTLFYDATAGTGGLADCTCDVYLHTGLITPESTDGGDWQFVRTVWATTNPDHKMTPVDGRPNVYSFELDIPGFYRFTDGTVVEQLAFVFRDGDGSREGQGRWRRRHLLRCPGGGRGLQYARGRADRRAEPLRSR